MNQSLRGDIVWAHLSPVIGSEQAGKRPVVIISGNTLNHHLPVRIVCPITSEGRVSTGRILIPSGKLSGLKKDSYALSFQVRTVSVKRLSKKIGSVTETQLRDIVESLNNILTY